MKQMDLRKVEIKDDGAVIFETDQGAFFLPAGTGIRAINLILAGLTDIRERADGAFIATAPTDIELERRRGNTGRPNHFLRVMESEKTLIRLALDDRLLQKLADGFREALEMRHSGSRH